MPDTKRHVGRGYAIVTKRGKVRVDTTCLTRREAEFFYNDHHKDRGDEIKRVLITVEE